jgi:hypothetical protein
VRRLDDPAVVEEERDLRAELPSTITATLCGAKPSKVTWWSSTFSSRSPAPFLIARAITSFGTDALRAASTVTASRGFIAGSGSPDFAAIEISRVSLLKSFPRFAALISLFFWSHWRPMRQERITRRRSAAFP